VTAALPWHPLAWLARRRLGQLCELACDDWVLASGNSPITYAESLLTLVPQRRPALALAAVRSRRGLVRRITHILARRRTDPLVGRRWAVLSTTLVWLAVAGIGLAQPRLLTAGAEPPPAPEAAAEGQQTTVTGRVLGTENKPLTGAHVTVLAHRLRRPGDKESDVRPRVLGRTKTDDAGTFRLTFPRPPSQPYHAFHVVAAVAGYGLGGRVLDADAERPEVSLKLDPEQAVSGRVIDLQGQPAAGVTLRVSHLSKRALTGYFGVADAVGELPLWPRPVTTDEQGRFALRGVGPGVDVILEARDDRFAPQALKLTTGPVGRPKEATLTLDPLRVLEGQITRADTGKPAAGVRLTVLTELQHSLLTTGTSATRSDAEGRFKLTPYPGSDMTVVAYPNDGTPYLPVLKRVSWPRAAVKHSLSMTLPRGVLVRGRVTEQPSGKAVGGAAVDFVPRNVNNPFYRGDIPRSGLKTLSGPDGTFRLAVLPGPGCLMVKGPTQDYVHTPTSSAQVNTGKPGGWRYYPDALVALDLKPEKDTHEEVITLKRGVTVKGRVVGPDGRPVAQAFLLSRTYLPLGFQYTYDNRPLPVRGGAFELPGCDPDKTVPVFFLDLLNQWGAVVELSGKQAGEVVTVRLAPCGSATARLVDDKGQPLANLWADAHLVITPGAYYGEALRKNLEAADVVHMANLYRERYAGLRTDARGRITFPALVPGATFHLTGTGPIPGMPNNGRVIDLKKYFRAEAGKTLDLGDITVDLKAD
jgi:protocatechuate 3,4-dioxygenase beta subunit